MKFKNRDNKENTENLTIEQREKRVRHAEYVALAMLVTGCSVAIGCAGMLDKIYKSYNTVNSSSYYKAIESMDNKNDKLSDVQKLMDEIENMYETAYIDEIDRKDIDEYVLNSLVEAYGDKYAVYRDPEDSVVYYENNNSELTGIGILARSIFEDEDDDEDEDDYYIYITDIYEGSGAEEAGLKIGDRIIKVKGKNLSASKYNFSEAINDIRGEQGTGVTLTVIDGETNEEKDVEVTRKHTITHSVRYEKLNDEVGYISIRGFEGETANQFHEALEYFKKENINKFIFDLRDNSGGLKIAVVDMLDELLPEGLIMKELDSEGNTIVSDMSDKNCIDFDSVTLISESTASAAEVFTQSLIDYNKTTTIGETSFGKGTVCTTFNLSNGGTLTMSTGRYVTKSGKDLEKVGIKPDIEMKLSKDKEKINYKLPHKEDDLIQKGIEVLTKH